MLETWPEVFISPIGTVSKGEEGIRVINDYAYPRGASVNDFTDRDNFPRISYNPPRDIAQRIHDLRTKHPPVDVLLLLGDVSGAFRHVPINENSVHMFAFLFEDYVVFDYRVDLGGVVHQHFTLWQGLSLITCTSPRDLRVELLWTGNRL
ncbi:hypothetical protein F444_10447 [Phytophthora nicotianae P1976]|uniref:Uncharacterized protein n=1 Tax=Phytophthora nicotianae P1976 TaxID=1317066 RepID=A0A081A407_PHYNI|nr:hypothetical protein F444_10447 [Phytophthora nicotianae P1976]